jgi:hypothetical protein
VLQAVEVGAKAPTKVSKLAVSYWLVSKQQDRLAYSDIVSSGLEVVDRLDERGREGGEPEEQCCDLTSATSKPRGAKSLRERG